jgi:hypothetical protein
LQFDGLDDAQREFGARSIRLDVTWSGAPNDELAFALLGSADGFAGLTVGGNGTGGDVQFDDDADVAADDLTGDEERGMVGRGRPSDPFATLTGEPLGTGWTLGVLNLNSDDTAQIEACQLTVIASE